jgi:hypothetical protein
MQTNLTLVKVFKLKSSFLKVIFNIKMQEVFKHDLTQLCQGHVTYRMVLVAQSLVCNILIHCIHTT